MKLWLFLSILFLASCGTASNSESNDNSASQTIDNSSSETSSTKKKCHDMDSYQYGYDVARDQDGLLADCNYLYEIASTQKEISSKSCFCEGVSDYRSGN